MTTLKKVKEHLKRHGLIRYVESVRRGRVQGEVVLMINKNPYPATSCHDAAMLANRSRLNAMRLFPDLPKKLDYQTDTEKLKTEFNAVFGIWCIRRAETGRVGLYMWDNLGYAFLIGELHPYHAKDLKAAAEYIEQNFPF